MTETWTFTDDFSGYKNQIRAMIGDVVSTDPLITDNAIAFFYARAGSDVLGGAILAARACAAKLALEFDRDIDGLKTSRSQRHKAMLDTITNLEREQSQGKLGFTMPSVEKTGDYLGYPKTFETTDLSRPSWVSDDQVTTDDDA